MKKILLITEVILSLLSYAHANTDVNFKGTVHETPECTINGGQPILVNFGSVDIDSIDGVNNSVEIDYNFDCPAAPADVSKFIFGFSINATSTSFDSNAISTSKSDLGIKISSSGVTVPPGGGWPITSLTPNGNQKPILAATLVKSSGSSLTTGDFTAAASLSMTFL